MFTEIFAESLYLAIWETNFTHAGMEIQKGKWRIGSLKEGRQTEGDWGLQGQLEREGRGTHPAP